MVVCNQEFIMYSRCDKADSYLFAYCFTDTQIVGMQVQNQQN